jgi:hypothetical protein
VKQEWKKSHKNLYGIKIEPVLLDVPAQQFIMIDGEGNPNAADFSERVGALYSLAYAVKMGYKKTAAGREVDDFAVYPLEGVWRQKTQAGQGTLDKNSLEYTIMIAQPDFITPEMWQDALAKTRVKKPNPLYEEVRFGSMSDGRCVSILHIGAFDDEPRSFAEMDRFCREHGLQRRSDIHREIYLSNANRTAPEKRKTLLRYAVK